MLSHTDADDNLLSSSSASDANIRAGGCHSDAERLARSQRKLNELLAESAAAILSAAAASEAESANSSISVTTASSSPSVTP
jgi:hypothetical protein